MGTTRLKEKMVCRHSALDRPEGLVLVTIGSQTAGSQTSAKSLCDALPPFILGQICRYDLKRYDGFLADSLVGHRAAIIVDSSSSGLAPGTSALSDLSAVLERTTPLDLQSSHGRDLADELRLAKKNGRLPKRIMLFGLGSGASEHTRAGVARGLQPMSQLARRLEIMVSTVLAALKREE